MAFTAITNDETEVGKPVKKSLWRKVKDNFDDHETRINSVETFGNLIEILDISPKDLGMDVGKVVASRLTVAEFQEAHGDNWVLCDGQSAAGTYFNELTGLSNVPDYRNAFLRGLPVSGRTLGDFQVNSTAVNGLSVISNGSHVHQEQGIQVTSTGGPSLTSVYTDTVNTASANLIAATLPSGLGGGPLTTVSAGVHSHSLNGDSETTPDNYSVNYFIKADRDNLDKFFVYKTKQNITLTDIRVEVIHQDGYSAPTSGTLEIDVRTGNNLASLSSIFNTKPNVTTFAEGDASGTPDIITTREDVDAGQYIVLDITSLQKGQSQIYLSILAEPR